MKIVTVTYVIRDGIDDPADEERRLAQELEHMEQTSTIGLEYMGHTFYDVKEK